MTNNVQAPSDDQLVALAKQGDFDAFEQLVTRHQDRVYRLVLRFVRNEHEAQEVVQETFLSIWRNLDGFKGESQFGSWLYRIAANAALMRLRSQRRHPEVSTEELPADVIESREPAHHGGENWARRPDDQLQTNELRSHIQRAVDSLPEMYRSVFIIRDVEGLSTEETAEILGITVPTVKTRLHRARLQLRRTITDYFGQT